MIRIFVCAALCSISTAFAATPFEELVGCYNTVLWNGKPTPNHGKLTQSQISIGESMAALNLDNSVIPSVEMSLFQKQSENTSYFGYAFPMLKQGSYSQKDGITTFEFLGQVRSRAQPEYVGTLNHKVEYQRLSNGNVWIHNYINVKESDYYNVDETYELEPTSCD